MFDKTICSNLQLYYLESVVYVAKISDLFRPALSSIEYFLSLRLQGQMKVLEIPQF